MRRILWIPLLLFCGSVHAQLLPIIFDQAVALPEETDIWDVMPHPDGYYVWVAATEPQTEQTRIYWGRMDVEGYDSLDLAVGAPQRVVAFWRNDYEPTVLLASRYVIDPNDPLDSTLFRLYSLSDGIPDSAQWWWPSEHALGPYGDVYDDYRLTCVIPNPQPPLVSSELTTVISHSGYHWNFIGGGHTNANSFTQAFILRNALDNEEASIDTISGGNYVSWTRYLAGFALGSSAHAEGYYWNGNGMTYWFASELRVTSLQPDAPPSNIAEIYEGCDTQNFYLCGAYDIVCAQDSAGSAVHTLAHIYGEIGVLHAPGGDSLDWTLTGSYNANLAADVVPNNGHEEFLCYDPSRQVFDILDPVDGHSYGSSTVCGIMNPGARIISRYDSIFRRLALRSGNQLQLYRFGEYLAADENFILPPSSFSLSNFPNPFNSATQIRFDLPQTGHVVLKVYNITGREVAMLKDETMSAGSHAVDFDASSLPSGVYIYRLTNGAKSLARKMVLLR